MTFILKVAGAAVLISSLCLTSPLCAQNLSTMKEVVVTANRFEQSLDSADIGATVLLGDDLIRAGVSDANEAVRKLGGLLGRRDLSGGREASIDIRGYGDSAGTNLVVVVDGVRISENEISNASLASISSEMIERIEILRGGNSVMWGEGATSGVIHVITRRRNAESDLIGKASVGGETMGGRDARASLSVGNEWMGLTAQVRGYATDGFRKNSAFESNVGNATLSMGHQRTLLARLSLFSDTTISRLPGALTLAQYQQDATQTTHPGDNGSLKSERVALNLERNVGDLKLAMDYSQRSRQSGSNWDYGAGDSEVRNSTADVQQISPRAAYVWEGKAGALNAMFGADLIEWKYGMDDLYFGAFPSTSHEKGKQSSEAGYANLEYLAAGGLRVAAGVRNEQFHQRVDDTVFLTLKEAAPNLTATSFAISQKLASQFTVYGRMAASYRLANVDEIRYLAGPLKPQETRDGELGLRFTGNGSSVAARLFQQSTENEIACTLTSGGFCTNSNVDPVDRKGAEIEATADLNSTMKLVGTAQALSAVFRSGTFAGNTVPLTARTNVTARIIYSPNDQYRVEGAVRSVGSMPFGNDWANRCDSIPQATYLDIASQKMARKRGDWGFQFAVENLSDLKTYSVGYTNATCSAFNVYPDSGRKVKFSADYRF
jgi:iron complex outermembrane receptor protein